MKSIVYDINYKPSFSGHETFPLRQMWLVKAFNAVSLGHKGAFSNEDAIVTYGVGRNMVSSIRHWALACGIIESNSGNHSPTELGRKLFENNGLDQYCEHFATSWLAHWNLAGHTQFGPRATTWYLAFNHIGEINFSAEQLIDTIKDYLIKKSPSLSVSPNTISKDVNVFFNSYVLKPSTSLEDIAEPMLAELGLIQIGVNGLYEFRRGPKATLPDNVFLYALIDFWKRTAPNQKTLSFEAIAYDHGSPGRVFKLDEDSVAERLIRLSTLTNGKYIWSDTAGQKIVGCREEISLMSSLEVK